MLAAVGVTLEFVAFTLPLVVADGTGVDVAGDGVADATMVEAGEVDEGAEVDDALDV